MVDPATVWLDAGVELARDVVIEPNVQLRGATTVGEGATVGPDTTLTDVTRRRRGEGGPHARRRRRDRRRRQRRPVRLPAARHRAAATSGKIGTFVEVKNSEIGKGTKVPHLSYVGDATIGEYSNIGAASVFVNYDGVTKRRTTVGSHARTGSDNMFVAPVNGRRRRVQRGGRGAARRRAARRARRVGGLAAQHRRLGTAQAARHASGRGSTARTGHTRPTSEEHHMNAKSGTPKKNLMFFSGRAHPELAEEVAKHLNVSITPQSAYDFANGEIFVRFEESVRGCDAFVIQSHCEPINQWVMEQLIMVDALKRASAKRITVIMPFYPYARQDKKHKGREPISARLIADLFKTAGADRIMTVDLHTAQIQGFFDGPVDHLFAQTLLAKLHQGAATAATTSRSSRRTPAARSWPRSGPTTSAACRSRSSTRRATRCKPNEVVANRVVGEVRGRLCVVIDDMVDTGGTIAKAVEQLVDEGAADCGRRRVARRAVRPGARAALEVRRARDRVHQHAPDPGREACSRS